LWQAFGVLGKGGTQCALIMSRLAIINCGTMLGAILDASQCPWVEVLSLARSNVEHLGTPPVCRLQFSLLMGAVLVTLVVQDGT